MNQNNQLSVIQRLAYLVIIAIGVGWLLNIGSSIILPLIFSVLFAIFLTPLERKILNVVKKKWASIILTFSSAIIPLILIGSLFSYQLVRIFESLPSITKSIKQGGRTLAVWLDNTIPLLNIQSDNLLMDGMESAMDDSLKFVKYGLSSTTEILGGFFLTIIFTYLIMYYRKSISNFVMSQFEKNDRKEVKLTVQKIKDTVQAYVGGVGIVVVILSFFNTIGLWLIGIEYPLFWGTLAGVLSVIPYVGTMFGGLLPFLFAMATTDHNWQPIAVIVYYVLIQQVEGNFITPKIVGGRVNINPLVAIIAILFFGILWGVAGIILALPIISIIRIIMAEFASTHAIAELMGSDIADNPEAFKEIADS